MALIPGFEYDIYISYSHLDNIKFPGEAHGWVTQFQQNLNLAFARRFGRVDLVKFYYDDLVLNQRFENGMEQAIKNSAIFICLNSRSYIASEYCNLELKTFYNKIKDDGIGRMVNDRSRIVHVALDNLAYEEWHEALSEFIAFPFHNAENSEDYGDVLKPSTPQFKEQIKLLRDELFSLIQDMELTNYAVDKIDSHLDDNQDSPKGIEKEVATTVVSELKASDGNKSNDVFISYNHGDQKIALDVYNFLTEANKKVIIDVECMEPTTEISDFIKSSIENSDFTISLISDKSLKSGWVGLETATTFFHEKFVGEKKFIGCYLDDKIFDDEFALDCIDEIEGEIKNTHKLIKRYQDKMLDTRHLNDRISRLIALRHNFDKTLQNCHEQLILDLRKDEFMNSMAAILKYINKK
ncbi:toll/interleukin-1 receptor domain-containing protein [Maribacter sp. CXY002]|uniref:toll/interleukin-1 receptor domain-containing protein n=1 Tax=Maribacter luteocoastalis TaxID=3407671 RepID=UPI003B67B064